MKTIIRKRKDRNDFTLEWALAWGEEYAKKFKNSPQGMSTRKIGARIVELIKRDPLSKELTMAIEGNLASLKKWGRIKTSTDGFTYFEFNFVWGFVTDNPKPEWMKVMEPIAVEIQKKWYCHITTTIHKPVDKDPFLVELFPVDALWAVKFNILSPVEVPLEPVNNLWPIIDVIFDRFPATSAFTPINKLPIFIYLSIINKNTIPLIEKIVGETVKECLKKFKNYLNKKPLQRRLPPVFYDKDLLFLYNFRKEETFQNYLRWYDWHIKLGIDFRKIAVLDNELKLDPESKFLVKRLDEFIHKKRKWGTPVHGEERIKKGVKEIYRAIFRKPYNRKKLPPPVILLYECPDHKNIKVCIYTHPPCEYLKDYSQLLIRPFQTLTNRLV